MGERDGMTTKRAKFTPGPWDALKPLGPGDWAVLSKHVNAGGTFYVASLPCGEHAEAAGNASLIAAAPDLLNACKSLLSWALTIKSNVPYKRGRNQCEAMDMAEKAIEKAGGKEV